MPSVRAIRWHGNKDIRLDHVELTPLEHGQARIAPAWCGICGSDLGEWAHGPMLSDPRNPTAAGHEFTGIVREVHPSVTTLKPGARIVALPADADDSCHMCVRGCHSSCENQRFYGFHSNGGLADLTTIKASMCFELPESIPFDIGALIEPLAVAWNAIESSGLEAATDLALVIGTGTIGLATVACLVALGVETSRIMVVGRNSMRNEKAREFGIEKVFSSGEIDVVQKSKDLFETLGPDVVFDAAATPSTFIQGLASLRIGGTYWAYGLYRQKIDGFDANLIPLRRLTIRGAAGYDDHIFPTVIKALENGRLNHELLRGWITGRVELEDTQKGLVELEKRGEHIKILVRVNDI